MFTFRTISIISIICVLFALLQTITAVTPKDDENIYPKTSFADNNGGLGNLHINKSENSTNIILQPSNLSNKKNSTTHENKFLKDAFILYIRSLHQRFNNKTKETKNNETSLPVVLNKRNNESPSKRSSTHSRRHFLCTWSEHCEGNQCTRKNQCSDDPTCTNSQCADQQTSWTRTEQNNGWRSSTYQVRPTENYCSWAGHCEGAPCETHDDCSQNFVCNYGRCNSLDQPSNTNTNPLTNIDTNTNTLTNIDTNVNTEAKTKTGSAPSQSTNVGGDGGNGMVVINVYGGNGGGGGSSANKIRL